MQPKRPPTGDSLRSRSNSPSHRASLGFSPRRKSRALDSQRLTKRRQDLLALEMAQRAEITSFFDLDRIRIAELYVKGISETKDATIARLDQDVETLKAEAENNLKGYRSDLAVIARGLGSMLQDCLALGVGGDPDDTERQALEAVLKRLQAHSNSPSSGGGKGSTPGSGPLHDISALLHAADATVVNSYEFGSVTSLFPTSGGRGASSVSNKQRIGSAASVRQPIAHPSQSMAYNNIPSLRRASSSTSASISLRHSNATLPHHPHDTPSHSITGEGGNGQPSIVTAKMLQEDIQHLSAVVQQLLHSAASRLRFSSTRLTYLETLLDQQQSQLVATDRMLNNYLVRAPTDIDRSIDMVRHVGQEVSTRLDGIETKALGMVDKLLADSAPLEYLRVQAAKAAREGGDGSLAHSMLVSEQQSLKAKYKDDVRLLVEDQAELINFLRGELLTLTKKRLEVAAGKGDLAALGENTPIQLLSLPEAIKNKHDEEASTTMNRPTEELDMLPATLKVIPPPELSVTGTGNASRISLGHTPHPEESSNIVLNPATAQPSPTGSPPQRRIQPVTVLESTESSDIANNNNGAHPSLFHLHIPSEEVSTKPANKTSKYIPSLASHAQTRGGPSHYLHRSNLPPAIRSRLESDPTVFDRTELLRIIDLVSHEPRVAEAISAVVDEYLRWEAGAKQKLSVISEMEKATATDSSLVETRPRAPTDPPTERKDEFWVISAKGPKELQKITSSGVPTGDPKNELAINAQRRLFQVYDALNLGSTIATAKSKAVQNIIEQAKDETNLKPTKPMDGTAISDILQSPNGAGPITCERYKRYAQRAIPDAEDYSHNNLYTRDYQAKVLKELYNETRQRLLEEEEIKLEGTELGSRGLNTTAAAAAGIKMGVSSSTTPMPRVVRNNVLDPATVSDPPRKALLLASPAGRKWYDAGRIHQVGINDLKDALVREQQGNHRLDGTAQPFDHLPALGDPRASDETFGDGGRGASFFYRNPKTQSPWTNEELLRLVKRDEDTHQPRRISDSSASPATLTNTSMLSTGAVSLFKGPSNTSFPSTITPSFQPLSYLTQKHQSLISYPEGRSEPQLYSRYDNENPLAFVPLPPRDPSAESRALSAQQRKIAAAFDVK